MTTFKKTNKERKALMNLNTNFKTFLMMTPTYADKDPKWIIRGFISGRRNYNKNVMKQLYDIMFNVRLRRRSGDRIAVYLNTKTHPFYSNCDGLDELTNENDKNYRFYNGDELEKEFECYRAVIHFKNGRRKKVRVEPTMITLVDTPYELHKKKLSNIRLFTLKEVSVNGNYWCWSYTNGYDCLRGYKYLNYMTTTKNGRGVVWNKTAYDIHIILDFNAVRGRSKMKKADKFKALMKL
jgi:hypothetical protein